MGGVKVAPQASAKSKEIKVIGTNKERFKIKLSPAHHAKTLRSILADIDDLFNSKAVS